MLLLNARAALIPYARDSWFNDAPIVVDDIVQQLKSRPLSTGSPALRAALAGDAQPSPIPPDPPTSPLVPTTASSRQAITRSVSPPGLSDPTIAGSSSLLTVRPVRRSISLDSPARKSNDELRSPPRKRSRKGTRPTTFNVVVSLRDLINPASSIETAPVVFPSAPAAREYATLAVALPKFPDFPDEPTRLALVNSGQSKTKPNNWGRVRPMFSSPIRSSFTASFLVSALLYPEKRLFPCRRRPPPIWTVLLLSQC